MSIKSTEEFLDRFNHFINLFIKEWDITYAEIIGCLELIKADILEEARIEESEGNDGQ